jgi:hypothetical protein
LSDVNLDLFIPLGWAVTFSISKWSSDKDKRRRLLYSY